MFHQILWSLLPLAWWVYHVLVEIHEAIPMNCCGDILAGGCEMRTSSKARPMASIVES